MVVVATREGNDSATHRQVRAAAVVIILVLGGDDNVNIRSVLIIMVVAIGMRTGAIIVVVTI